MKISTSELKRQNKISIYRTLLHNKRTTKPEIAARLNLSLPTIGQLTGELVEQGLVQEDGMAKSLGGRRAVYYRPVLDKKLALGVDITRNHVGFALLNLSGDVLDHQRSKLMFVNNEEYGARVNEAMCDFLKKNGIEEHMLIGVGYSVPGIVSQDRMRLDMSHILNIVGGDFYQPKHQLNCPYLCFNDADAACMVECYEGDGPENFSFLSLSNTVGGALVFNREIQRGITGRCGEIGHMCVVPGPEGRMCYCGRRGHYDAYGSAELLAGMTDGNLEEFFRRLETGEAAFVRTFEEYLDMLAVTIQKLNMFTDMCLVIGGYVGNHLEPYLERLKEKVDQLNNPYFTSIGHIRLCRRKIEAAAVGVALYFIDQFIQNI